MGKNKKIKFDKRRAIDCKLIKRSATHEGYCKYIVTIGEKDGTTHQQPVYGKDMQEDKETVFDTFDTLILVIKITQELIENMKVKKTNMYDAASKGFSTATDLADWFVRDLGMPFREAHALTGKYVEAASEKNIKLSELSLEDLKKVNPKINKNVFKILSPENSIESRNSFGGTASREIKRQIRFWKRRLDG